MKVVEFPKTDPQTLDNFLEEIKRVGSRPGVYLGFCEKGNPVLHMVAMPLRDLAHLKVAFEMHCARDWLSLMGHGP